MRPGTTRISQHLTALFEQGRQTQLSAWLDTLSHADFRTASRLLAERYLPMLGAQDFWLLFVQLAALQPKAYLGTLLKAAVTHYLHTPAFSINNADFILYLNHLRTEQRSVDQRKISEALLPFLRTSDEVTLLLDSMGMHGSARMMQLFKAHTLPCYYILFVSLCNTEGIPQGEVRPYVLALLKQQERLSYNFAALLASYFSVSVPGVTLSLQIAHYQLSYISGSYEAFAKVLQSV